MNPEDGPQFKMLGGTNYGLQVGVDSPVPEEGPGASVHGYVSVDPPYTAFRRPIPAGPGHQEELFHPEHHPAVVGSAFFDKRASHHLGTALGIAANEASDRGWGMPVPSNDLSQHSAKVVNHLIKRGIIEHPSVQEGVHPDSPILKQGVQVTNEISHAAGARMAADHYRDMEEDGAKDVSPHDVARGRFTMRAILRGGNPIPGQARTSTKSKQFKQLGLAE